jgi:hypothetical protein
LKKLCPNQNCRVLKCEELGSNPHLKKTSNFFERIKTGTRGSLQTDYRKIILDS